MALGQASDVTGVAAVAPSPASGPLAVISAILKGGEIVASDDKTKTITGAAADYAGGKYTKALTIGKTVGKPKLVENAAEAAGGKIFETAAGNAMDKRPGSAKNQLKASEAQRQQKQQQDLKLLNGE